MRGTNERNVVMIADDDLFVRKVIRTALDGLADLIEVADGAEVQEAYTRHMPDLLFLDIHLPNKSGLDLLPVLLKSDAGAFVIMVSADSSEENVLGSKYRGSRGFLAKPFKKDRILAIFNKCPTIRFSDR